MLHPTDSRPHTTTANARSPRSRTFQNIAFTSVFNSPLSQLDLPRSLTLPGVEYPVDHDKLSAVLESSVIVGGGGCSVVKPVKIPRKTCDFHRKFLQDGGMRPLTAHSESVNFAVKVVALNKEEYDVTKVRREIEISSLASQCPYAVKHFGQVGFENTVCFFMEWMDINADIYYKNVKFRSLTISDDSLRVFAYSMIRALNHLKKYNIMHRDVKPSNVLVNCEGAIKLCDFGISRRLPELKDNKQMTHIYSAHYLPPERRPTNGRSDFHLYDFTSDVWCLGVTLTELALLMHPFIGYNTPKDYTEWDLLLELSKQPRKLDNRSPEFVAFVDACIQDNYMSRPSYEELLEHSFIRELHSRDIRQIKCEEVSENTTFLIRKNLGSTPSGS